MMMPPGRCHQEEDSQGKLMPPMDTPPWDTDHPWNTDGDAYHPGTLILME
uniref:Uncharacterized protein n=1 Tax=Picea glauca TaxID=3330 RepID=A0A101M0P2_PICGL|nr:hypothetical protein ABT39_MTgene4186 [Picea glauca]